MGIRMSGDLRDWINKQAKKEGVTPSEYVRFLVIKAMVKA